MNDLLDRPSLAFGPRGKILVPATCVCSVTKNKFVFGDEDRGDLFFKERAGALPKICSVSPTFVDLFCGKMEGPTSGRMLYHAKLRQTSTNREVLAAFGGEVNAEILLTEMLLVMKMHDVGEVSLSLRNPFHKVWKFYVKGTSGELCIVATDWDVWGWKLDASSLEISAPCHVVCEFFSPDPDAFGGEASQPT